MPYRVAPYHQVLRILLRPLFRGLFRILSRVSISGEEHVPSRGPYLVVFNHVSIYDPPFMIAFWPKAVEVLGANVIWQRPGQNVLVRLYGSISVRRGELDRRAMESMLAALRDGKPLLISPEGGRSHVPGLRQAKSGVVYLVEKTRACIIPVGVTGTTDDFIQKAFKGQRPELKMKIGQPFNLPDDLDDNQKTPRENRQRKADYIMTKIAELLPESYQGWYGSPAGTPTGLAQDNQ
jgi:1-acyl-sn-glycerol-3-phosphate acyltransferase